VDRSAEDAYRRRRTTSPDVAIAQLEREAEATASAFDAVAGARWRRPGRRSDGASFTVETFAVYFLHDVVHHVHDVARR